MPYGYNGKILRVDLTNQTTSIETPPETFYRRYMGGRAIALYYLLKEQKPGIDPLAPESMLIFAASVITGAPAPAIPRYTVAGKSVMTGGFGESEAGGNWGPELKKAGFDAIIITGRAPKPVYLFIQDGVAEIRDAGRIWGKDIADVERIIKLELDEPRVRVASIGVAGENLVKYACILNDIVSANGRHGFGAVMGSKKLKAIAVRGHGNIELFEPESVMELAKWVASTYRQNSISQSLSEYGSCAGFAGNNAAGMLPTSNFKAGAYAEYKAIEGEVMRSKYIGKKRCFACPIGCKKLTKVVDERFNVDSDYGSPEYETIAAFGSNMEIADANVVIKANELCNRYGLDTISTGVTISFAMECYQNDLLTESDTGGLELRFGNSLVMLELIDLIAHRKGIGDLLAEGSVRAAAKIGGNALNYCNDSKGLEYAMHDPRAKYAVAIGYATAIAGPDHMSIPHDTFYETLESIQARGLDAIGFYEPVELLARDVRKAKMAVYGQIYWGIFNVLGACVFGFQPRGIIPVDKFVQLVKSITGFNTNLFDLMEISRRAINLAKLFNLREGLSKKDDTLPRRAFEPLAGGRLAGVSIEQTQFENSRRDYYQLMGWDAETGIPLPGTLNSLDIAWAAQQDK